MKNLKKIAALVIVLAMALSSVAFGASFSDVDENASYSEAVEVMAALDLIAGYEDGTFGPEKTITRAEFAAIIVRAIGMEDAAAGAVVNTVFTDVAADNWAAGYIQIANQRNIIAGYGDGRFGPTDEVTYEQAVKMIVCALGYGIKFANVPNAYPSAYLSQANTDGITVGAAGKIGEKASRATVAKLVYNALDVAMMVQKSWGTEVSYEPDEDETLLKGLNVTKYEEVTVDTVYFDAENANKVVLVGESLEEHEGVDLEYAEGIELKRGYSCVAYIDETDDEPIVLAVVPQAGKNKVLELTAAQLKGGEDEAKDGYKKVKYFGTNAEADDDKYIKIANDAVVITNKSADTKTFAEIKEDLFDGVYKNVTLIDSIKDDDENDAEGYDYIFVTDYYSFVVEEISERRYELTGSDFYGEGEVRLDPESETITFDIKDANGKEVAFEDIEIGDVVNVFESESDGTYYYEVIVTDGKFEGAVEEIDEDDYYINGEAYTISEDTSIALQSSDSGLFTADMYGVILKFELATGNRNFGIAYKFYEDEIAEEAFANIYTANGECVTYEFADKVKVGGVASKITWDEVESTLGEDALIVMYVLNGDKISEIYFGEEIEARDANLALVEDAASLIYKESSARLSNGEDKLFLAEDSILVSSTEEELVTDKTVYSLTTGAIFNEDNDEGYTVSAIVNADDKIVFGIVFDATPIVDNASDVMIVTKKATVTDAEGNSATKLTGYIDGESTSIVVTDNTYVYDFAGDEIEDAGVDEALVKGSLIQVSGEGEAIAIRVLVDGATLLAGDYEEELGENIDDDDTGYLYAGQVAEIVKNDFALGENEVTISGSATYINLNNASKPIKVDAYKAKDIETDEDPIGDDNDDFILVYRFDGENLLTIILDNDGDTK